VGFSATIVTWFVAGQLPADHIRLTETPLPFVGHALGGVLFGLLGPLQFAPRLRGRWPALHRASGRVFVAGGLLLAITGLWLLALYPASATWPLQAGRLFMSFGLLICLPLAVAHARRRDISQHRAWMIRGYAIGIAAGTQSLILFPYFLFVAEPEGLWADLVLLSGWVINISVAEIAIRRDRPRLKAAPIAAE
jgi:uncharacterized membrane protein